MTRSGPGRPEPAGALVVAHRGDSTAQAEHTTAAYRAALATGADGLECDVRLTRDGHLVCVHDRKVDRTSNGRGIVSELDLAGLSRLDFSSWHESAQPEPPRHEPLRNEPPRQKASSRASRSPGSVPPSPPGSAGQPDEDAYLYGVAPDRDVDGGVLTLKSLLLLVAGAARPVHLLIETKHPTRYAGLVEKELVRVLRRFRQRRPSDPVAAVHITVMSFATTALRRVRLLAPEIPTVLLVERLLPGWRPDRPATTSALGPSLAVVRHDPDLVARVHARGQQVYVWTVDDEADIEFVLRLGVDAVITNDPAQALRVRERLS